MNQGPLKFYDQPGVRTEFGQHLLVSSSQHSRRVQNPKFALTTEVGTPNIKDRLTRIHAKSFEVRSTTEKAYLLHDWERVLFDSSYPFYNFTVPWYVPASWHFSDFAGVSSKTLLPGPV